MGDNTVSGNRLRFPFHSISQTHTHTKQSHMHTVDTWDFSEGPSMIYVSLPLEGAVVL